MYFVKLFDFNSLFNKLTNLLETNLIQILR